MYLITSAVTYKILILITDINFCANVDFTMEYGTMEKKSMVTNCLLINLMFSWKEQNVS